MVSKHCCEPCPAPSVIHQVNTTLKVECESRGRNSLKPQRMLWFQLEERHEQPEYAWPALEHEHATSEVTNDLSVASIPKLLVGHVVNVFAERTHGTVTQKDMDDTDMPGLKPHRRVPGRGIVAASS